MTDEQPKATIHPDTTDEAYRADPGKGQTDLKKWAKGDDAPIKGSYLEIGTAVHLWLLEGPEAMVKRYGTKDQVETEHVDLRSKVGRSRREAWETRHHGLIYTRPDDRQRVKELVAVARENELISKAIATAKHKEVAVFGQFDGHDIPVKAKIDLVCKSCLMDIKTTHWSCQAEFEDSIIKYGYDIQAAFYVDLYQQATGEELAFVFACISTQTLDTWVYQMPWQKVAAGRRWYQDMLGLYKRECDLSDKLEELCIRKEQNDANGQHETMGTGSAC